MSDQFNIKKIFIAKLKIIFVKTFMKNDQNSFMFFPKKNLDDYRNYSISQKSGSNSTGWFYDLET